MDNELIPSNEFQTAVPSSDGLLTDRTINNNSPSNNDLLDTYSVNTIDSIPEVLYTAGTCFENMNYETLITTKEELFIYLCEVLIRFDANPLHYQKEDYEVLINMLIRSLIYLYDQAFQYEDLFLNAPYLPLAGGTMNTLEIVTNLNADLLDGHHADEFALVEHSHPYEPLLGTPIQDGYILSSIGNTRIWVPQTDPQIPSDWLQKDQNELDYIKNKPEVYVDTNTTRLISGTVIWLHDLTFQVSDCVYYISGTLYYSPATTITLDPADPDFSRLDIIYVDTDQLVGYITGFPEENFAKPIVEPISQLELTTVLIPANATEPANINETVVYNENIEWVSSITTLYTSTTIDFNNAISPKSGSKQTRISKTNNFGTTRFQYIKSGDLYNFNGSTLILSIRISKTAPTTAGLVITLKNYGTQVGSTVTIRNGTFGFVRTNLDWQTIAIPYTNFAAATYQINTVQFSFSGTQPTGTYSIDLDDVRFQNGIILPPSETYVLPIASATILGGIKVGTGLSIDANGILNSSAITPVADILDWSTNKYTPYATKKASDPGYPYFYGFYTTSFQYPSRSNPLYLDGTLFASQLDVYDANTGSLSLISPYVFSNQFSYNGIVRYIRVGINEDYGSISAENISGESTPIIIGTKIITALKKFGEYISIDDYNRLFEINMTNVKLTKGTASKLLTTDATKIITYIDLPGTIYTKDYWTGTQSAYDALGTYAVNTIYFVEE